MIRSFPHYQQLDEMDCGSTSLRMIARYYGKVVERGTHHDLLLQRGYYYELVKNQLELDTIQ